jgi:hypothetical protein
MERWYVFLNITSGPYKRKDLPRLKDVPRLDTLEKKWQDVTPCAAIVSMVSLPSHLYLGAGVSLHLDRVKVHDLIKQMNDKEQLHRYAVKSVKNYQPAEVFEGGNGFVDLPGLNDVDTSCAAQTREGIKNAGVVFVVLAKSLNEDQASLRLLKESETLKRAAAGEANVVFLFNRETQNDYRHRELETKGEVDVRARLEESRRDFWRTELGKANDRQEEPRKTEAEIEQIANDTPIRTIYPMLHYSYKLNWNQAMRDMATQGALSGSKQAFELSNVDWLLGMLQTLNRQGLVDQLKRIATVVLPALREKLKDRLENAKNSPGELSANLVDKATKKLKGHRALDRAIGIKVAVLNERISELGHQRSDASTSSGAVSSIRLELEQFIVKFMIESREITTHLDRGRVSSQLHWNQMSPHMKAFQSAYNAVDPSNDGVPLFEAIFGNNSRQVPFSFGSLVSDIAKKLTDMRESVVDMVIEQVDGLLLGGGATTCELASLRDSFVTSDVIKPLEDRFSVNSFIKTNQRDYLLNNNKLDEYQKRYAAQQAQVAIKNKILSRSSEQRSAADIRRLVQDSREPVREEWRKLLSDGIRNFVGAQFFHLTNDLQFTTKQRRSCTVKRMMTAYLKHVVTTAKVQQNGGLQQDLSAFIHSLARKTDSPRSLWARLDGQSDPRELGIPFARHVERRRQREQTEKLAQGAVKLGDPNKPMPVIALSGEAISTSRTLHIAAHSDLFQITSMDKVGAMRAMLRDKYNLEVVRRNNTGSDLFGAVALVAYTSLTLEQNA